VPTVEKLFELLAAIAPGEDFGPAAELPRGLRAVWRTPFCQPGVPWRAASPPSNPEFS
jgi:hypothetical protein